MKNRITYRSLLSSVVLGGIAILLMSVVYFCAKAGTITIYCDLTQMERFDVPSYNLSQKLGDIFHRSLSPAFIIAENFEENKEIVKKFKEYIDTNKHSPFSSVLGLSSTVPDDQEAKKVQLKELAGYVKKIPKSKRGEVENEIVNMRSVLKSKVLNLAGVPTEITRKFLPRDPTSTRSLVMISPSVSRDTPEAINRFTDEIRWMKLSSGKSLEPIGEFTMLSDILKMISRDAPRILIFSLLLIFIVLVAGFRSLNSALLIFLPLLISFFLGVMAMQLIGFRLDIFNIVVFPAVLGTGVDNLVHIYVKYLREGRRHSVSSITRRIFSSLVMTSGTTFLGFGALVFADHKGLESAGWVSMLLMATTFFTTIALFPYLVRFAEWISRPKIIQPVQEPSSAPVES